MIKRELPFGVKLRLINEAFTKQVNAALLQQDLTLQQSHLLRALSRMEDQTCSMKEMEKIHGMAQSTIAGIVCRLEKKHLIESMTDPADKRIKRIRLTAEGNAAVKSTHECLQAMDRLALSGLSPEENRELNRLLQQVLDTLSDDETPRGCFEPRRKENE